MEHYQMQFIKYKNENLIIYCSDMGVSYQNLDKFDTI